VVERSTHNPNGKGLNPATATGRLKSGIKSYLHGQSGIEKMMPTAIVAAIALAPWTMQHQIETILLVVAWSEEQWYMQLLLLSLAFFKLHFAIENRILCHFFSPSASGNIQTIALRIALLKCHG
jgi:hypothetical protein